MLVNRFLAVSAALVAVVITLGAMPAGAASLKSGIDRRNFDTTIGPGQDFFFHVNGNWIRDNPIPDEYSGWGAFNQLRDESLDSLRKVLESLDENGHVPGGDSVKLRDLYHTALDQARVDSLGAAPIADELALVAQIGRTDELAAALGRLHAKGIGAAFHFYVGPDEQQSDRYAAYFGQGGLGLPERDYYLGHSADSRRIREAYRQHVAAMLGLLGETPEAAQQEADTVLNVETRFARASRTPVQLRDVHANYHKQPIGELAALTPDINWNAYLKTAGVSAPADVIVRQPEFFRELNAMFASISMPDWRLYLRWHVVHAMAPYLAEPFEQENFRFFSGVLRGTRQMQPRWKRAVRTLDGAMGEPLGRLYVQRFFPPESKQRMDELVRNILAAYRERIASRDWMGPETRRQAIAKLDAFTPKIGYPSTWRDYSGLQIRTDSYAANVMRANVFDWHFRVDRLGKPVDRGEWGMTPPTVNAYYNPSLNEIVFPAGILRPPFFDPTADDAVNYGAIGAVIGHEISHGFDDQGSHYDGAGNMKEWWTAQDRARFAARTDRLVAQYDACVALDDLHVNGKLTLGENIADLGGVTIAHAAWVKSLRNRPSPVIDGFTGEQRFFIGYAQIWRASRRDADVRVGLRTDPHSPPRFRTLVPLSNFQPFYDAFDIKPGDAMYRAAAERVEVW